MNFRFLFHFLKKENPILKTISGLKRHRAFTTSRFDLYLPTIHPDHLIVLLGQMHTVFSGSISNRERKKIVACQTRLVEFYEYFYTVHGISSFGSEGMYEGFSGADDLRSFKLYQGVMKTLKLEKPSSKEQLLPVAQQILSELGRLWQEELKSSSDISVLQNLAMAVSGQTLFDYLHEGNINSFPIEGERQYKRVLEGISALGKEIERVENTYEMRVVRQRDGKASNEKETQAVRNYNALVKEFNGVIGSDIREKATLDILRERSNNAPMTVFTMGVGHRKNYLKLASEFFGGSNTAFLFITPKELLPNWWCILGLPFLALMLVIGLLFL